MNTKFLNGARFLFALWVFIDHFHTLIGASNFIAFPSYISFFLNDASPAITGFMIITGFLMTYNYIMRKNVEPYESKLTFFSFWTRRFFRLYPIYFLTLIVSFIFFTRIASYSANTLMFFTGTTSTASGVIRSSMQPGLLDLISHIFLIHGLIPSYHTSILGVAWSLSLETQFYILFPFLFLLFFCNSRVSKQRLLVLLLAASFISLLSPRLFGSWLNPGIFANFNLPSMISYMLPIFLLGMILAAVGMGHLSFHYLGFALITILPCQSIITNFIIGMIILLLYMEHIKEKVNKTLYLLLSLLNNMLSGKFAEFGANISYSLYLIHAMIISLVLHFAIYYSKYININKYGLAVVSLALSILVNFAVSHLLYLYLEKPLNKYGKRVSMSREKGKTWLVRRGLVRRVD